jgi:signal transduction histidine kinase
MRTLLLELRPAALAEAHLDDLLRQLAEAATGRTGAALSLDIGECSLPPPVRIALYRIAQEALNNVMKHAQPSEITLSLRCPPGNVGVTLLVQDDGRGFEQDCTGPECLGLGIMRERAEAIGAELRIESALGQGTTVRVTWPGEGGN